MYIEVTVFHVSDMKHVRSLNNLCNRTPKFRVRNYTTSVMGRKIKFRMNTFVWFSDIQIIDWLKTVLRVCRIPIKKYPIHVEQHGFSYVNLNWKKEG